MDTPLEDIARESQRRSVDAVYRAHPKCLTCDHLYTCNHLTEEIDYRWGRFYDDNDERLEAMADDNPNRYDAVKDHFTHHVEAVFYCSDHTEVLPILDKAYEPITLGSIIGGEEDEE